MIDDRLMRRALWATVFFNMGGALLFGLPDTVGSLAALPVPVPTLYSVTIAYLILLFSGAYAWLAMQPHIDRPLVAFLAIGKAGFFVLMLVCWLASVAPGLGVVGAAGDLAFAAVFASWLAGSRA